MRPKEGQLLKESVKFKSANINPKNLKSLSLPDSQSSLLSFCCFTKLDSLTMALSRFSSFLSRTSNNPSLLYSSSSFVLRSLINVKTQTLSLNSTPNIENPFGSMLNPHFIVHKSTHTDLQQTVVLTDASNQTPQVLADKIVEDAENICKLLSKNPNSRVEALLNKASMEVSPSLVFEALKKLSNAGALALSFFRWAEKQKGFQYSTESYHALIESLGKIKQFNVIWNLVTDMKQKGLLNKETFALISRRYARARKVKEAVDAFMKMEKFGLKIESSDVNRLLDTLCKSRQVERAQLVFDKMNKRGFVADIKSYTILLEGWGQEKNLSRLMEVYNEMKDEGFEPDVVTYGILINAHCKSRRYDDAIELFHEMEAKNCNPSPHIYCTLINGLGAEKRLSEALEFFELSKASGFVPEAPTYNAVVGAYCWSERMDDVQRTIDEMRKGGVGPSARTYDIILHHLIRAGKTKIAYSVFQKMSCEGCEPSVSTYEIIVRMFCNEDRVDMAIKVWDQMKAKGILPVMHMFSTLINSLCHESKLDEACMYFQEMLDVGIRPPAQLFSNLKQNLLDEGKKDTVVVFERKLDKLRQAPLVN